jgi:hypothetical protein
LFGRSGGKVAQKENGGKIDRATYLIIYGAALAIPVIVYALAFDRSAL